LKEKSNVLPPHVKVITPSSTAAHPSVSTQLRSTSLVREFGKGTLAISEAVVNEIILLLNRNIGMFSEYARMQ